ncbi:MAG: hypothetical protein ACK5NT_14170 [Pyrinomonadaceae bacterium]
MRRFELPFALIHSIEDSILEIVFCEAIEIDMDMVTKLHKVLESFCTNEVCILVNNINEFNYSFEAQMNIFDLEKIVAVSFVCYTKNSHRAVEAMLNLPRKNEPNAKIFYEYREGIEWLEQQFVDVNNSLINST